MLNVFFRFEVGFDADHPGTHLYRLFDWGRWHGRWRSARLGDLGVQDDLQAVEGEAYGLIQMLTSQHRDAGNAGFTADLRLESLEASQCIVALSVTAARRLQLCQQAFHLGINGDDRRCSALGHQGIVHCSDRRQQRIDTVQLTVGARVNANAIQLGQRRACSAIQHQKIAVRSDSIQAATDLYGALEEAQRKVAVLPGKWQDGVASVKMPKKGATVPGLAFADMTKDQKALTEKVMTELIAPYRKEDGDEVMEIIKANGGMEKLAMAFYQEGKTNDKEPWSHWRLEGPGFVWSFRALPHIHTFVNVSSKLA